MSGFICLVISIGLDGSKRIKRGKFNLHYLYDAICILAQRNAKMLNSNETNANSGMNANASSEFGDFMSASKPSDPSANEDSDLFGILKKKDSSKQSKKDKNKSFLPSQLFDLDQSLYSQQSPRSGRFHFPFQSMI